MLKIDIDLIRKLREATGAPVIRVKKVLDEVKGDIKKATEILKKKGFEEVSKRKARETTQGLIETYVHHSRKIASLIELLCETDFVARNEIFKNLAHDIALQVASMESDDVDSLLKQEFIKDPTKKVEDLLKEVIVKTGENIRIGRFYRIELGK